MLRASGVEYYSSDLKAGFGGVPVDDGRILYGRKRRYLCQFFEHCQEASLKTVQTALPLQLRSACTRACKKERKETCTNNGPTKAHDV